MPYADFGEKVDFSASLFTKLKAKGDKIHFRIIGSSFYDGKHFMKTDDGWDVVPCPRINEGTECEICNMFFAAHKDAKKRGLDKTETDKLTRDFKPSISFYFPILNRETGRFEVFQTTQSVRNSIEEEVEMGTDVLNVDFIVLRTEKPGSNYYKTSRVDSKDTKALTKDEKAEVERGKKIKLENYINGQREESTEDVDINNLEV